eukprot:1332097-Amorphochlora_amoeboformis.AAC.1
MECCANLLRAGGAGLCLGLGLGLGLGLRQTYLLFLLPGNFRLEPRVPPRGFFKNQPAQLSSVRFASHPRPQYKLKLIRIRIVSFDTSSSARVIHTIV